MLKKGFKFRIAAAYLLYSSLTTGADFHGMRLVDSAQRPIAQALSSEARAAEKLLMETLESPQLIDRNIFRERLPLIKPFPEVIRRRVFDLLTSLKSVERYHHWAQAFCLELLATTENPELIPVFETYLRTTDREGEVRFPAASGLGAIYKRHPNLINQERKQVLFGILNAKDDNDLARLYLRQHLPQVLGKELDEQIYQGQKLRRPGNVTNRLTQRTKKEAAEIALNQNVQAARRALAFQALLEIESPNRKVTTQLNEFLKQIISVASQKQEPIRINDSQLNEHQKELFDEFVARIEGKPRGLGLNIHDGIQIENLLSAARRRGIELDQDLLKNIRELTDSQFGLVWNAGNSLVKHDGDSNLSTYAHSAMILSRGNRPLSSSLNDSLKQLQSLRNEQDPETSFSRLANYTSESHRKDATPASSAGRLVTSQLVFYESASLPDKPQEAQRLLEATKNFENHFSQLFEIANHFRTHDRHPGGEGMASYYGFGNVPYAAEALVKLKNDPHLNEPQHREVRWLADRIQNRLLNLMRFEDSFTDNRDYNNLAIIALKKLDSAFGSPGRQ